MRKAINTAALVFFIWLVLDTYAVPDKLLYFLAIGALPGTATTLPPSIMLAIMSGLMGFVVFEAAARRFEVVRRIRRQLLGSISRREQLPSRRYTRI